MKKMKRLIGFFLCVAVLLAVPVSCGIETKQVIGELAKEATYELLNEELAEMHVIEPEAENDDFTATNNDIGESQLEESKSVEIIYDEEIADETSIESNVESNSSTTFATGEYVYQDDVIITINSDVPYFMDEWETLSVGELRMAELDYLGRCGPAIIKSSPDTLPTDERGSTGQIKPTGWHQNKYEGVVNSNPPYLYNRAHLIMRAICGVDSDKRLLITGTRYFNVDGMLPIEMEVLEHAKFETVLYRVTPVFEGDNLLATGVLMEAINENLSWSICKFVFNVQPGVFLDYATGENWID